MTDDEFELLIQKGMESVPARFLEKMDNVAIVIADAPTKEVLRKNHISRGGTLLGLYEGIPLTERGEDYGMVLPDKITLFKKPILDEAEGDMVQAQKIITDTLWHEIAHYFGFDEEDVKKRENDGRNFSV